MMQRLIPDLPAADDEILIALVTQGSRTESQEAMAMIYERYHKDVWRFIRSMVSSETEADEISGEVWVVVSEKIYSFKWRGVPIKEWLFKIAKNKVREFARQPSVLSLEELDEKGHPELFQTVLHEDVPQLHSTESETAQETIPEDKKVANRLLHRALSKLSADQYKIIKLKYFEGVESLKDIAKRLGMKASTVRVYKKRAEEKIGGDEDLGELY